MATVVDDKPVAPERSMMQRLEALEKANAVRSARAELKRDVKAGRVDALLLLECPPSCLASMPVFDFLRSVPRVGPLKAGKLLNAADVSPRKLMGGLTARQRGRLAWLLASRR